MKTRPEHGSEGIVHPEVARLVQRYGLDLLHAPSLEYRPHQWPLIQELLASSQHIAVSADTGEGKTLFFILKALQVISRGGRAAFTTVKRHLVEQVARDFLIFSKLQSSEILAVSGKTLAGNRAQLYEDIPRVIITTRETALNDIQSKRFIWEGICLFGCDEFHHGQGSDAYTNLFKMIVREGVQRLFFSASPATTRERLSNLINKTGAERYLILPPHKANIQKEVIAADLDDETSEAALGIKEHALTCYSRILSILESRQVDLFDNHKPIRPKDLPSYAKRRKLKTWIERFPCSEKTKNFLRSTWSELGLACWLHEILVSCGRAIFLESFGYRYAKYNLSPMHLHVLELAGRASKPGFLSFENRLVNDPKLYCIFAGLAEGTPYEQLLVAKSWEELTGVEITEETDYEANQHNIRDWFDCALLAMAQSQQIDHPKIQDLKSILDKHPPKGVQVYETSDEQQDRTNHTICLTGTRRHCLFLAHWINHRYQHLGIKAGYAFGPRNTLQLRNSQKSLDAFRNSEINLLVSTDYIREGLHVPKAAMLIEFWISDSNPIKKMQGRGRVGRQGQKALIFHLVTRHHAEAEKQIVAGSRSKRMRSATYNRGELLLGHDNNK